MRRLQLVTRLQSLLVGEPPVHAAIDLTRVVPPAQHCQRVDQQHGRALPQRPGRDVLAQQPDHLVRVTPAGLDRREHLGRDETLLGHVAAQRLKPIAHVRQGLAPPQFERLAQQCRRLRRLVPLAVGPGLPHEPAEAVPVDGVGGTSSR